MCYPNFLRFFYYFSTSSVAFFLSTNTAFANPNITPKNTQYKAEALLPIIIVKNQWLIAEKENNSSSEITEESPYLQPPQVVPKENVPPFITSMFLNGGQAVNHLTDWEISTNYLFSNDRSENLAISAITQLEGEVVQSVSQDNVFRFDFQGNYLQLKTLEQERMVTTTFREAQTLNGFAIQQTFTGPCSVINPQIENPDQQCSFLPSLVTDPNSIDPDFLTPTRIEQEAIGRPISDETLAILAQPGFQNIGADGKPVGLNLDFPNVGALPNATPTEVERREDIDLTYSGRYYNTRQVVKANHERSILGRTVRGMGIIGDEDNIFLNAAVEGMGQLLPDVIPELEGSENPANTNINRNLFLAANNTRLPENSFVIYQGGIGKSDIRKENELAPSASFNSIWLGLSPVVERSLNTRVRFNPTEDRRVISTAGGEGGINDNVGFTVAIDDQVINSNSFLLDNFYIQNYIQFTEQAVDLIREEKFIEETNYYPHLSLTGNITSNDRAFRYYGGVIASTEAKVYVGADYTQGFNGWRVNIAAIGYTRPDREYFSKAEGVVGKQWRLAENTTLTASTGFRYAWDRPEEEVLDDPIDNNVNVGVSLNFKDVSLNVRHLFDVLPNSTGNQLRASIGVDLSNQMALGAYYIPQRGIESFGITGEYQFLNGGLFDSLIVQWNRSVFDFGTDSFDNELKTNNDTFSILLNISE